MNSSYGIKMKILAVSLFYKPIWPGFGVRVPQLILDEAARCGHEIVLFTGRIPQEFQDDEKYTKKRMTDKIGQGTIEINRLWTPSIKHEGILKRVIAYFIFMLQCYFKLLFTSDYNVLIALHPYPPFFIFLLKLARFKKIKSFLMQGDLWPDNLLELKIITNTSLYSFIIKLSKWAFNLADIIVVITDELKHGTEKYVKNKSKIKVLELATDTKLFRPMDSVPDKYNGKFVVLYNGIFSPNYDFDIILNAAKYLENENILFVIAGAGELKNFIQNEIKNKNLKNVNMEEPLKNIEDLVIKINRADILLLGMNDNIQSRTAHPSKLFEFMACGKPVICSGKGATLDLLQQSQGGILVEPKDSKSFSEAILKLYKSSELRKTLGNNGRKYIEKHHSLEVFRNNLSKILASLAG